MYRNWSIKLVEINVKSIQTGKTEICLHELGDWNRISIDTEEG
jgi:hypothetical protein